MPHVKFGAKDLRKQRRGACRMAVLDPELVSYKMLARTAPATVKRRIKNHFKRVKKIAKGKNYVVDDFCANSNGVLGTAQPAMSAFLEDMPPIRTDFLFQNFALQTLYVPNESAAVRCFFQMRQLRLPSHCPHCDAALAITDWMPFTVYNKSHPTMAIQKFLCPDCNKDVPMTVGSWLHHFRYQSFRAVLLALMCYIHNIPCHLVINCIIFGMMGRVRYYQLIRFFRSVNNVHLVHRPIVFHSIDNCPCFDGTGPVGNTSYETEAKGQCSFYNPDIHSTSNGLPCTKVLTNIVAMDEALMGKMRKFAAGDFWQRIFVFGISTTTRGRCMLQIVPNVRREALVPHILRSVCPNITVYTDCAAAYFRLRFLGYRHRSVNHSKHEFVHRITRVSTNSIEGLWGIYKRKLSAKSGLSGSVKIVQQHLAEFSYRSVFGDSSTRMAITFLKSLRYYHEEAYDHMMSEVVDVDE